MIAIQSLHTVGPLREDSFIMSMATTISEAQYETVTFVP